MDILDSDFASEPENGYEFYRDFFNAGQVADFVEILQEHRIPYRLEKSQPLLVGAITGHGLVPFAVLKLRPSDFKKINDILARRVLENPHFLEGHYLQQFDARELLDVVKKPDEWTPEDAAVARRILEERGIAIPDRDAQKFQQKRNEQLREGRSGHLGWMAAYLLCVMAGGILVNPVFLIAGIGMGWYYWQDKTIDTDGRKFFTFEPGTRRYGQVIFYIGWVSLGLGFALVYWSVVK